MKVYAKCPKCLEKDPEGLHFYQGSINDDFVLTLECPATHQVICVDEKFELFYDAAFKDYISENYESTILFSHTAFESHVLFLLNTLLYDTAENIEITKIRNSVQKHAVKALGAFLGVFTIRVGKAPKFLKEQPYYELRNKIIHTGKIPTQEQALDYLRTVYETISFNQIEVRKLVGEQQTSTKFADYLKRASKITTGNSSEMFSIKSPFAQEIIIDFDKYLDEKIEIRRRAQEIMNIT